MNISQRIASALFVAALSLSTSALCSEVVFGITEGVFCPQCKAQLQLLTNVGPQTLDSSLRGVLTSTGGATGVPDAGYQAGFCTPPDCNSTIEYRDYFAFRPSDVGITAITQATLLLTLPAFAPPLSSVTLGSGPANFIVHGLPLGTIPEPLTLGINNFNDLGASPSYGNRVITQSDVGTIVSVPLNTQGVAYLQSIVNSREPVTNPSPVAVLGGIVAVAPAAATPLPTLSPVAYVWLSVALMLGFVFAQRRFAGNGSTISDRG